MRAPFLPLRIPLAILVTVLFACPSPGASHEPEEDVTSSHESIRESTGIQFAVFESLVRRNIVSTRTPYGFKIRSVKRHSAAHEAGLRRGDIVLEWNGRPIRKLEDVAQWIRSAEPGERVELQVSRRRKPVSLLSRDPWKEMPLTIRLGRVGDRRAKVREI